MAFQTKDFLSVVASMVNHMRGVQNRITDFNVGGAARTLIEAPAVEIDELYQQMFHGLKEAIPVAIYNSFNFAKLAAQPATGVVRVTITSAATPTLISAGTIFTRPSSAVKFVSQTDTTIAAGGTYADVYVAATTAGAGTNIVAAQSFSLSPQPARFLSASNSAAFTSGADAETDSQQKSRFAEYIASINHGTVAALKYGLKTMALADANGTVTERVKFCAVVEPYVADANQPVGWVQCYIHNGVSGASSALLSHAASVISGYYDAQGKAVSGWKAAGVKVDVLAATSVPVNVTAVLTALPGYSAAALVVAATDAISQYLLGLNLGDKALRAELIAAAMAIDGVYNFAMTAPTGDTTTTAQQKAMPGTIAITPA